MICIDAFKNLNLESKQGELYVSPCCVTPTKRVSEIKFFDDPYLKQIRRDFSEGRWPKECEACQSAEAQNQPSRRIGSNKWYENQGIDNTTEDLIRIDYWVGDTCNCACVMCGPSNSSLWKQQLSTLTGNESAGPIALLPTISENERKANRNLFWHDLDLGQLQYIHFHGGEPLLSQDHEELLRAIPEKSRVHVYYNTNGTIRASQGLRDLWQQFRLVQIDFSVDDIDNRFDFIRFPAKWPDVRDNILWYREHSPHNCMFNIATVVTWLNQPYLHHLSRWIEQNFSTNRFSDPVEQRFQPASGWLSVENSNRDEIFAILNKLDGFRGTDWKTVFPEAYQALSQMSNGSPDRV